jgi:hypothetical protein
MALYKIYNAPMPTTASIVPVATGTAIKTLLQVVPSATNGVKVKEWGISMDASAAATPGICELIETDVAATVTAHVTSGIHKLDAQALNNGDPVTNLVQVGTALTGYTASAEGTITAVRELDAQQIAPTNQYVYQWVLGNEGIIQPGKFGRIRVKFGASVNALCYMVIEV